MDPHSRPRRLTTAALTAVLAVLLAACAPAHPNSIFTHHTEFNRDIGHLFDILIWLGSFVFVFVESILLIALIKFRKREGQPPPQQVHGNTKLEILWTSIPALILAMIAVPTVRTIFKTEAPAAQDALQVTVTGHQWWWEFQYPQYGITTANELYLPIGRTVNFTLRTADVIHSFWIPELGGKRDLISNHTNYLWFTPDSVGDDVFNGFCAEFCGTSHANMRFKVFTVAPAEFAAWTHNQEQPAVSLLPDTTKAKTPAMAKGAAIASAMPVAQAAPATASFVSFPRANIPRYAVPATPLPPGMTFDQSLTGDPLEGEKLISAGQSMCLACHTIKGNPMMQAILGPDLTHIASRTTIAAGLYPNDKQHLELWIKNARVMKPGVIMYTLGKGQIDPATGKPTTMGNLTDQQIADIVAYLQTLK
ncbi:MAG TPA: cytochrome c oxidase subunit II [Gemmatimonadaceae bacterium]|nr:cytochrome c oxidase subunit II [Gemmatimonadaceae bacterium]